MNSRLVSRQPVLFSIAPDMLRCETSIWHDRCIQVLLQSSLRSRSSDADADVQEDLYFGTSQALSSILCHVIPRKLSSFLQLIDQELLLGCDAVQGFRFMNPIFCWNDALVSHWSLANSDSMAL